MSQRKPKLQTFAESTIPHLHRLLVDLHKFPHDVLPNPPNLNRRASVALIVRIRPHYRHPPSSTFFLPEESVPEKLDAFFAQDWVKHGDPELLFIKRAANERDAWNGHVAFPGGRRDPEDEDDYATAVRETIEEVGIDLRPESGVALSCGNMSQAIITASWGEKALFTFCPYVFLVIDNAKVRTSLQPSEVASTHWVPFRALQDPKFRSYWVQDVSSRTSKSDFGMRKRVNKLLTGDMFFAAVRLHPSESVFATETLEYLGESPKVEPQDTNLTIPLMFARARLAKRVDTGEALLLWGLTLSVVCDFLDMLPPYDTLRQFVYPNFSALDVRFWVWLMSWSYRRKKVREAEAIWAKLELSEPTEGDMVVHSTNGKLEDRYFGRIRAELRGRRGRAAFDLMPGYYPIIRQGTIFAIAARLTGIAAIFSYIIFRRWRG